MSDCRHEQPVSGSQTTDASAMDCCGVSAKEVTASIACPECGETGKAIDLLGIKSMLLPSALASLDAGQLFRFCASPACETVYYGEARQIFRTADLRVKVFQKDAGDDVPVCYCFGWTRARLREELQTAGESTAVAAISAHIKAGRCACEVNNPQASCCLGNVTQAVREAKAQGGRIAASV